MIHSPALSRGEDGFTLLEMLLVLVILALCAALVIPYAGRDNSNVKTKAATGVIAATMKRARGLAVRERSICTVSFAEGNRMLLVCSKRKAVPVEISLAKEVEVVSSTGRVIEFFPAGGSSGANIEVKTGSGELAYTIRVEPTTGHVRVKAAAEG